MTAWWDNLSGRVQDLLSALTILCLLLPVLYVTRTRKLPDIQPLVPPPTPSALRGIVVADLGPTITARWAAFMGLPATTVAKWRVVRGDYLEDEHGNIRASWGYDTKAWQLLDPPP